MAKALDMDDFLSHLRKNRADYAAAAERHLRDHHANQGAVMAVDKLIAEIENAQKAAQTPGPRPDANNNS